MTEPYEKKLDADAEASRESSKNPYRSPDTAETARVASNKRKLGGLDWFFAIVMGILAAIFVFPSTCLGALVLFNGMGSSGSWILVVCSGFSIVAALYVGWLVLRARANRE